MKTYIIELEVDDEVDYKHIEDRIFDMADTLPTTDCYYTIKLKTEELVDEFRKEKRL